MLTILLLVAPPALADHASETPAFAGHLCVGPCVTSTALEGWVTPSRELLLVLDDGDSLIADSEPLDNGRWSIALHDAGGQTVVGTGTCDVEALPVFRARCTGMWEDRPGASFDLVLNASERGAR